MKKTLTTLALVAVASASFAQGIVGFANQASTLISANGTSIPGSNTRLFYFAVFMAPSSTVTTDGLTTAGFADALWGNALYTTVNHATSPGRLATTAGAASLAGITGGSTYDFIVRGWSADAGATYAQALTAYNSGNVATAVFGTSRIGNNIIPGDGAGIGTPTLFGVAGSQVIGFNLTPGPVIPEPSSMALAGLGAASLLIFRRRK